jgi:hypothetical protein
MLRGLKRHAPRSYEFVINSTRRRMATDIICWAKQYRGLIVFGIVRLIMSCSAYLT